VRTEEDVGDESHARVDHAGHVPDSWNAYDSLGEALLKAGDTAGAQKMYEKSVALKPDSKSGLDALRKLRDAATAK